MSKIYRFLATLLVVVLVVLGLNASHQGTSSLTLENQKPLVGFTIEKESVNIFALGEQYSYSGEEISQDSSSFINKIKQMFWAVVKYLKKIWTIFRVIFLT